MTTAAARYERHVAQLQGAAADPAHPQHEASTWVLHRARELQRQGVPRQESLRRAVEHYRAIQPAEED